MKFYTLLFGKSKKRMKPIMIDEKHKCENYMEARLHTTTGWHKIVDAPADAKPWRIKSSTIGGYRPDMVGRVGHGKSGWIGKNGFQEHT